MDRLVDLELDIRSLSDYEDQDIVFMTKKIEKVEKEIEEIEMGREEDMGLEIRFHNKKEMYDKLGYYLLNNSELELTTNAIGLIAEEEWICLLCENRNLEKKVDCKYCHTLRNLDTLPNLTTNPNAVTEEEIKILEVRRKKEMKLVCGRDDLNSKVVSSDGMFYIVSSEWLSQWKAFIFNKPFNSTKLRVSSNKRIGVLPPGPIANHTLFIKGKHGPPILKPFLEKVCKHITYKIYRTFITGELMSSYGRHATEYMEAGL